MPENRQGFGHIEHERVPNQLLKVVDALDMIPDVKESIRSVPKIVALQSQYVSLKRAGDLIIANLHNRGSFTPIMKSWST